MTTNKLTPIEHQKQPRRTQSQRRFETQALLIKTARELFGANGYSDTGLDDIAHSSCMTTRPIYHHFNNKLGLFLAVTEDMEKDVINNMHAGVQRGGTPMGIWAGFLARCNDPHFRQIILIDGPTLLGERRMTHGPIAVCAREVIGNLIGVKPDELGLVLLLGALSSGAMHIAKNGASPADANIIQALIQFHMASISENAAPRAIIDQVDS